MAQWTLVEFRAALDLHLKETGSLYSDSELDRAVTHALADFSRFYPRERFYETRLDFDEVTDEQVTLTAHGTYKDLANKPVKWDSERICDDAAETTKYTRGTDYEINYINGTITSISGGSIGATDTIFCNYTRDKTAIDISGLTYFRIKRVEYPVGGVPADYATYDQHGDILFIMSKKGGQTQSQGNLQNDKHARLWYYAPHTAATASAAGTAPEWSDEIVLKGAEAYMWLIEAAQQEHTAIDYLTTAATTLENCWKSDDTGALKDAETALAVATATLLLIATDSVHASAETALDAAKTELDLIHAASAGNEIYDAVNVEDCDSGNEGATFLSTATANAISAEAYLTAGDATIETVNVGEDVAPLYLQYANGAGAINDRLRDHARLHLERGALHMQVVAGYINEAATRLQKVVQYVDEAQAEIAVSNGYNRQGEILVAQASQEIAIALHRLDIAEKYREMGILRRNEFWAILGDRNQGSIARAVGSVSQIPSGTGGGSDLHIG